MEGRLQGREVAVLRTTQDDIYGVDAMSQKGFTLIELMIAMLLGGLRLKEGGNPSRAHGLAPPFQKQELQRR